MLQVGRCKHRRGPRHGESPVDPHCAKDIDIRTLVGPPFAGSGCRAPCQPFLWKPHLLPVPFCVYFEEPTVAEVAADEIHDRQRWAAAHGWTRALKDAHAPGTSGQDTCPICHGPAAWSLAAGTERLHAWCTTPDCLWVRE